MCDTYLNRENREELIILNWKQNVNYFFAYLVINVFPYDNGNVFIVDADKERSRETLIKYGISDSNIVTINRRGYHKPPFYYNCEMIDFHNYSRTKFRYAWLDCINRGKNMADIFKNFIRYNVIFPCIVGVTLNTRGRKTQGRAYDTPKGWESWIKKWCNDNDLSLEPINFDYDDYDFRIRKKCGNIEIPKNWAYNGSFGITEGTMSAFFIINKI